MTLIRVRVPTGGGVRPFVRCTFKRVIRTLPTALLFLFVAALVLVTLLQIALIHAQKRRPSQANATTASTTPKPPKGIVTPQNKKPDTLRVEAFLDRTAPTVEGNMQLVSNMRNCARLRRVMDSVLSTQVGGPRTRVRVVKSFKRTCEKDRCYKWTRRKACPESLHLEGRLQGTSTPYNRSDLDALLRSSSYSRVRGGVWRPPHCSPRHRVAVIIPFRDRHQHLTTLLHTLHPLMQRQMLHYAIYVVEQWGNDTFNKGVLMNAGAREALKDDDFHCLVFHDVDLLPEDDRVPYSCPPAPRHLSVAIDKFNYTLPYSLLVGGVFCIRMEHFVAVNGYSNLYWGWGGEDDDMAYRIKYRKLDILRPPETIARYTMIKHEHRAESPNAIRSALLRMAKKRSSRDGLNTAKFRIKWRHDHLAYTHLMVDIGQNHRWHFLNGQRLVINF